MQLDTASFKMAYEASRERLLRQLLAVELSRSVPVWLVGIYRSGYQQGVTDAMQFELSPASHPPSELEWESKDAWTAGYRTGDEMATWFRRRIMNRVAERLGIILTSV